MISIKGLQLDSLPHDLGMYAIEQTEVLNKITEQAADIALKSDYNFTKRYAVRLKSKFK